MFDKLDKIILQELQQDARISNADLARRVGLSASATLTRVKQLEKKNIIRQYAAQINRQQLGYDLLCFVSVSLERHQVSQVTHFHEVMQEMPEVLECHHFSLALCVFSSNFLRIDNIVIVDINYNVL